MRTSDQKAEYWLLHSLKKKLKYIVNKERKSMIDHWKSREIFQHKATDVQNI